QQLKKMGSLGGIMKMIPGMSQMAGQLDEAKADSKMKKSEAIILSMTPEERENPEILRASRKNRIAKGSGTQVADVNRVINDFEKMKTVMKQMGSMGKNGMGNMSGLGAMKNMRNMNKMMRGGKGRKF
ncbi:MAG: signal recognition particle protein, partial [Longicatena sp.]